MRFNPGGFRWLKGRNPTRLESFGSNAVFVIIGAAVGVSGGVTYVSVEHEGHDVPGQSGGQATPPGEAKPPPGSETQTLSDLSEAGDAPQ